MKTYPDRLFDYLFDNECVYRAVVDGAWPSAEMPYGIDVFVFELICDLESSLHKEHVLKEIYLECCKRLGIDPNVFNDDPVEDFLRFMQSTGFEVTKYKEYRGE